MSAASRARCAARSFIDAARPDRFVVVHAGERLEREHGGCPVVFAGPTELADLLSDSRAG